MSPERYERPGQVSDRRLAGAFICWEEDCKDRGRPIYAAFPPAAARRHQRVHYNQRNPPRETR